jgi:protein-disulfide isomerase
MRALLLVVAAMALGSAAQAAPKRVSMTIHMMSKCPYAAAVIEAVRPAVEALAGQVDFQLEYIASESAAGELSSMHGQGEVDGDILQLCARKHSLKGWLAFVGCQSRSFQSIPDGWEACADDAKVSKAALRTCSKGSEGKNLLRTSLRRSQAANAQGSPTIIIEGASYQGQRKKSHFLRELCDKISGRKPAACQSIPEDVTVRAIVISDKRCPACATDGLESNLRARFFPKLEVKRYDYGDPAGKKLYRQLGLKNLPIILLEKGVEKAEGYDDLKRWIAPILNGRYVQLRLPASFDPTAEICDNKIDDNGDGKIDCADPTCTAKLVCRKEIPRRADVAIMSQCPFAAKALLAMKEVLAALPGVAFDVHYIAEKTKDGFSSLHGQGEVEEDLRQLCIKKHYRSKSLWPGQTKERWLEYLWCRAKDPRSTDWQPCATGSGMSANVISQCAAGDEGKRLLEEDLKLAAALNISGSPTWLANNKHIFNGVTAQAIKEKICEHNRGLKGCDKKLTGPAEAEDPGGSCK